jgi:hypothetical protein
MVAVELDVEARGAYFVTHCCRHFRSLEFDFVALQVLVEVNPRTDVICALQSVAYWVVAKK